MAFVPGFDHDVFISYAAADNGSRPGQAGEWVSRFHGSLSQRLRELVGATDLNVYRDPKLEGLDRATGFEQVRRAALMVPIVSDSFVRSELCRRELEAFGADDTLIFPVWLAPVDRQLLPNLIAHKSPYKFFNEGPEGTHRRFDQQERANPEYWQALDDLSRWVVQFLKRLRRDAPPLQSERRVVYLAEGAGDVEGYRDRLRRALVQRGVTVLPERPLPLSRSVLRDAIVPDLRRSSVSVHLLGNVYGNPLRDGDESAARVQAEVAATVAREGPLRRVVWVSPEARSDGIMDARQREFRDWIETTESPDEFLEGGFEELKSVVFDTLRASVPAAAPFPVPPLDAVVQVPVTPAPATPAPTAVAAELSREVFISYSRTDAAQFAVQLGEALGGRGVRVWIDVKDIRAGTNFRRVIEEALYRCTHMLIVLSPKAVESDEVMGEVNVALDDKKPVVPVLFLPCRVPSYLRVRQHVNFTNLAANDAAGIAAVLEALGAVAAAS